MNILAAVAMFVQNQYGYAVSPELQAYALVILNVVLRAITKKSLSL